MHSSFKDTLLRARRGDRDALAEALAVVEDRMRATVRARISSGLRAQVRTSDILQTTYVEVVKQIGAFRGDDERSFANWLTRILDHNIADRARYHSRQKRKHPTVPDKPTVPPEAIRAPGPTPSREVINAESLAVLAEALAALDEDRRRVVELRLFEERSYAEVAALMGRSEEAVRMLYSRARAALALEINRRLEDEPPRA